MQHYTTRHVLTGQILPATTAPVSWTTIKWSIIRIKLDSKELQPRYRFQECVHCNDLGDMTSGQGHDTPLSHGQQLCEILSRSNLAVRSYSPDTDFGYVWPRNSIINAVFMVTSRPKSNVIGKILGRCKYKSITSLLHDQEWFFTTIELFIILKICFCVFCIRISWPLNFNTYVYWPLYITDKCHLRSTQSWVH